MRGGDLHHAGAEFRIDVGIGDDRNRALRKRQTQGLADQVPVALVVRMHRNCRVAEHRFGSRGCDHDVPGAVLQRIAKVPQRAVFLHVLHFEIGQSGEQHRVPVHQALAPVDEPLGVQAHKHFRDCPGQSRIHREAVAAPVDGVSEAAHLRVDGAARLLLPLPHPCDKFFAGQVGAFESLGVELAFDDHLGRNTGVVRSGLPERVVAAHAVIAGEGIHERVLEGMAHVQSPRNVGGRDHDAVGRTVAGRCKPAVRLPALVYTPLDVLRRVDFIHR